VIHYHAILKEAKILVGSLLKFIVLFSNNKYFLQANLPYLFKNQILFGCNKS